jgi:hypothetical protein
MGSQVGVVFLDNVNAVAQPLGHLVDADTRLDEQTGKGMPHDMSRDPALVLADEIIVIGAVEVVAIGAAAMPHSRLEREGIGLLAVEIAAQELAKAFSQRNRPSVAILDPEAWGVLYVDGAAFMQLKPADAGFYDFPLAHPAQEPGHEDESQVIGWGAADEAVALLFGAEAESGGLVNRCEPDSGKRRALAQPALGRAPIKESAQAAHMDLGRGLSDAGLQSGVVAFNVALPNALNGDAGDGLRKFLKGGPSDALSGPAIDIEAALLGQIAVNGDLERTAGGQAAAVAGMDSTLRGLGGVCGLQADVVAQAVALEFEPVDLAADVDAFAGIHCPTSPVPLLPITQA